MWIVFPPNHTGPTPRLLSGDVQVTLRQGETFTEEQTVPGPGGESEFQKYCGAEYQRVYALVLETIRANTAIDMDSAETLSRQIAAAHADRLYWKLTDQGAGASKRLNLIERPKARERVRLPRLRSPAMPMPSGDTTLGA